MYKFCFFVPQEALGSVKKACFAAGAGRIGDYDSCCWQVLGEGQFRPLAGSSPYIGSAPAEGGAEGVLERVAEYRVEMVCDDSLIRDAVAAMKDAHPYETPAYDVWRLELF